MRCIVLGSYLQDENSWNAAIQPFNHDHRKKNSSHRNFWLVGVIFGQKLIDYVPMAQKING